MGGQTGAKLLFIAQNHPQTIPFVHTTSKREFVIEKTSLSSRKQENPLKLVSAAWRPAGSSKWGFKAKTSNFTKISSNPSGQTGAKLLFIARSAPQMFLIEFRIVKCEFVIEKSSLSAENSNFQAGFTSDMLIEPTRPGGAQNPRWSKISEKFQNFAWFFFIFLLTNSLSRC